MGFASGSITFRRFSAIGKAPHSPDQATLDKLAGFILREAEFGVPEEREYGWSGGRHIYDVGFTFEKNVFNDALWFALRIDTNKVPTAVKQAYAKMEEASVADANPSGFLSKSQKAEVKETVRKHVEDDLRGGKYRQSKLVPVLWDLATHTVYSPATDADLECLAEIFARTFGLQLVTLTAGALADTYASAAGRRQQLEAARASRFADGPEGPGQMPEYPWVAKGPEPKDFLGNEFLMWLWHQADAGTGIIETGTDATTIYFDKSLQLECGYGQTGKERLDGDSPTRAVESRVAAKAGKVPRRAGIIVDYAKECYTFTLAAERMAVAGLKLPDIDQADSPRVLFEERIKHLRQFSVCLDGLFGAFLRERLGTHWEGHRAVIARWIANGAKPATDA